MLKPMRYIHLQSTCTCNFLLLAIKKEKKELFSFKLSKIVNSQTTIEKNTQSDIEHLTLINTIGITFTGNPHLWNTI